MSRAAGEPPEALHRPWLAAALTAVVAAVLGIAVLGIPRETAALPAVARYAMEVALPRWHSTEPVSEIVYGTRGFDTFGETFLLLAAVVSVTVMCRDRERRRAVSGEERAARREQERIDPSEGVDAGERLARAAEQEEQATRDPRDVYPDTPDHRPLGGTDPERAEAMTVVTRTAVRVATLVLTVAAGYFVAWGYTPGGGFPAGVVLLGVVLLLYAGFGLRRVHRAVDPRLVETAELAGAGVIIATLLLGLLLKGSFSANWLPLAPPETIRAGGILQVFSVSELVEVGTGLVLAVFAIVRMRHDWSPDEPEEQEEPAA